MADSLNPAPTRSAPALRAWPLVLLGLIYWAFQIVTQQIDMVMFARFMSSVLSVAVYLLVFIILWSANGTVPGRTRLFGIGLLVLGAAGGILLAHPSFNVIGFLLTSVPYVLYAWTALLLVYRATARRVPVGALALLIFGLFGVFDLMRWDGLSGRLNASLTARWTKTAEQRFLEAKVATPAAPASGAAARAWKLRPGDYPEFRGPLRDGVVHGVPIDPRWKATPPEKVWRQSVGPAWSSMILVDGFLVTQEQRGDSEAVVAYDATTGKEVWSHSLSARFTEGIAGAGPRATPSFSGGRIYALGGSGLFTCLEAPTGKELWRHDLVQEAGAAVPHWGFSSSPLVIGDRVIVFAGKVLAYDAAGGTLAWSRDAGKESYSSPQLVRLLGKPQIVMHDLSKLAGLSVEDGRILWERPGDGETAVPMLQPHPMGEGTLLVSTKAGLERLEFKEAEGKWTVTEAWVSRRFTPTFNDFVVRDGFIYGLDNGVLACLDARTGERVWKKGRLGYGQVLLLDEQGVLVVLSETGELGWVEARPQEPAELLLFPAIQGKTWNHLAMAGDRLFVRNAEEMACFRLSGPAVRAQ